MPVYIYIFMHVCDCHLIAIHPSHILQYAPHTSCYTPLTLLAIHPSHYLLYTPHTPCNTPLTPFAIHPSHPLLYTPHTPCYTPLTLLAIHPSHTLSYTPFSLYTHFRNQTVHLCSRHILLLRHWTGQYASYFTPPQKKGPRHMQRENMWL